MPVMISPTGVQAVHPDGEVAVARAAAARGIAMGLQLVREQVHRGGRRGQRKTFFQMYWVGSRDVLVQRMERARAAGAKGLIMTLDWSFSNGRDWGSPAIPEKMDLKAMVKFAPEGIIRPEVAVWTAPSTGSDPGPDRPEPRRRPAATRRRSSARTASG